MTDVERRAEQAYLARTKADGAYARGNPEMAWLILDKWGCVGDRQIAAALAEGGPAFRKRVFQRVLADPAAQALINRCPRCRRIVRTPRAKQCLWCHHDWHSA